MVSVLQDERDCQLAHSGPHIEVHPEGSLRTSTRVWSWVVTWSLPVLASSVGSIRLPRRYIFGPRITALREAGLYGRPGQPCVRGSPRSNQRLERIGFGRPLTRHPFGLGITRSRHRCIESYAVRPGLTQTHGEAAS
jgi:hypothetical protein